MTARNSTQHDHHHGGRARKGRAAGDRRDGAGKARHARARSTPSPAPGVVADADDSNLPKLVIDNKKKVDTVKRLRDLFAANGQYFEHGESPVHVVVPPGRDGLPYALPMNSQIVVVEAETICRPVDTMGNRMTLPSGIASTYLQGLKGKWGLRPLAGISTAPILAGDGSIRSAEGYDEATELWCTQVPALAVPAHPSEADAKVALKMLRHAFYTMPFGDGEKVKDGALQVIDQTEPPGHDESAFLVALLTAIARPSLWLAPGYIINAPGISGAGTGKGLLVRSICAVAFGWNPVAFTLGHNREEMDKRLSSELMRAQPAIFLDNVNAATLRSSTLASAITERPSRCRIMGTSKTVLLNTSAFIAVTGNGLNIGEDLCRRFINSAVDAGVENPELRKFEPGFRQHILNARAELLTAALTIWRWGRQHDLKAGLPLGGFEEWSRWCRDPLLTLGCQDPVRQIYRTKQYDPSRMDIDDALTEWERVHKDAWVPADQLAESVKARLPRITSTSSRQAIVTSVRRMVGARVNGRVLEMYDPEGKWSTSKYRVRKSD
jgi:putative DNA primase/helicase